MAYIRKKKYLTNTKKEHLLDFFYYLITTNEQNYPTFDEGGNKFIIITYDEINYELERHGYYPYCKRQLYRKLVAENNDHRLIIKTISSSKKAYGMSDDFFPSKKTFTIKNKNHLHAPNTPTKCPPPKRVGRPTAAKSGSKPILKPLSGKKNKENNFSTYIDIYKSYKSYKSNFIKEKNLNLKGKENPEMPVLVTQLANIVTQHLGTAVMGNLDKHKSQWLHAAYKKLGSTLEAFDAYIKQLATRTWLKTRNWFGFKWIFTFANIDKILSGQLKDFVAEKVQEAFKGVAKSFQNLKQTPEVLEVKPDLVRSCEISSNYFKTKEFPKDTTKKEIQAFVETLKKTNYSLAAEISQQYLNTTLSKRFQSNDNFTPASTKGTFNLLIKQNITNYLKGV